jgi:hypothetical protein
MITERVGVLIERAYLPVLALALRRMPAGMDKRHMV